MASNIKVGDTIRVTTSFLNYDSVEGEEALVDPALVETFIYTYNTTTNEWNVPPTEVVPTKQSDGIYYYDWTTPSDGRFKIRFEGTLADASVITNERVFYVGTAEPSIVIGVINPIYFLGELDPLYLDPEAILTFYPDGDLVEIAELVYWYSLEVQEILGTTNVTVNKLIQDYISAAVLCDLSKIHVFGGGLSGFEAADSFTLGDLQVSKSSGGGGSGRVTRGNVSTWCELAALLREELTFRRTNLKAVVKGSNYANPIPSRALRSFDG